MPEKIEKLKKSIKDNTQDFKLQEEELEAFKAKKIMKSEEQIEELEKMEKKNRADHVEIDEIEFEISMQKKEIIELKEKIDELKSDNQKVYQGCYTYSEKSQYGIVAPGTQNDFSYTYVGPRAYIEIVVNIGFESIDIPKGFSETHTLKGKTSKENYAGLEVKFFTMQKYLNKSIIDERQQEKQKEEEKLERLLDKERRAKESFKEGQDKIRETNRSMLRESHDAKEKMIAFRQQKIKALKNQVKIDTIKLSQHSKTLSQSKATYKSKVQLYRFIDRTREALSLQDDIFKCFSNQLRICENTMGDLEEEQQQKDAGGELRSSFTLCNDDNDSNEEGMVNID